MAIAFGQAPADAFTHAADAELAQQQIVFAHPVQVPRGTVHVQRLAAMRDVVGAFVAGLPVREEWRGRAVEIRHACLLIVSDSGGAGHAGPARRFQRASTVRRGPM